jgi:hypothetical protein
LQQRVEKLLALSEARAAMYAGEMGESRVFDAPDRAAEIEAVAQGCHLDRV